MRNMEKLEYKARYKARLIAWGVDEDLAEEISDVAEFDPSDPEPEDHADDEVSYMMQDT